VGNIKKLAQFLQKKSIRAETIPDYEKIVVLGVSNKLGITTTDHKKSKDLSKYQLIEESDFAYNPYRINVGFIGLVSDGIRGLVSPAYVVFSTNSKLLTQLLLDFLKSREGLFQIGKYARGTVRKALRFEDLCQIEMPIPSLKIQHNILKKKLSIQSEVKILEDEITSQQILLKKLRQAILQEAIEGKLTVDWRKQNPEVEPASKLLSRIQAEKEHLIKAKKIKKQKPLPLITAEEVPFELPKGWAWCRLGKLLTKMSTGPFGSMLHKSDYVPNGIPLINPTNIRGNSIYPDQKMMIDENTKQRLSKYVLNKGTIVIARRGDLSKCAIIGDKENGWLCGTGSFFLQLSNHLNKKYFIRVFTSSYFQKLLVGNSIGQTMSNLNQKILNEALYALPPFAEQKAIVTKVEKLLTVCDQLEQQINSSQVHTEQLMQSVLKEAFQQTDKQH